MKQIRSLLLAAAFALFALGCTTVLPAADADSLEPAAPLATVEPAANPDSAQTPSVWTALDPSAPMYADLDGDGVDETIEIVVDEDAYTTDITIRDGEQIASRHLDVSLGFTSCAVGDTLSGDGHVEVYISGDAASDDYETHILRYEDGQISSADVIYGSVTSVDGLGLAKLETSIDVFGTYGAYCGYRLGDDFVYTLDTPYTVIAFSGDNDRTLVTKRDALVAARESDQQQVTLPTGSRLTLVFTDEVGYAVVKNEADGELLRIAISRLDDDWRWFIAGVPEDDWFEQVLYAG